MKTLHPRLFAFLATLLFLGIPAPGAPQKVTGDGDELRSVFKETRKGTPSHSVSSPSGKGKTTVTPPKTEAEIPGKGNHNMLGVTLWVTRQAKAGEEQRALRQQMPVRADIDQMLHVGQQVRISVESMRPGYLYIVDQEKYDDGTLSEPSVIFPTTRTRHGNNKVGPGFVVEVPDQHDDTPYLTVESAKPNLAEEVITMILTAQPVSDIKVGPQPVQVSRQQLAAWVTGGLKVAQVSSDPKTVGSPWTIAEMEAGVTESRQLSYRDPAPQTLFRFRDGEAKNLVLEIPLRVKR